MGSTQALIHGDLHSGSIMVKEGSTFVIDPEFAYYGPMGFDIGAFLSNLLFNYFSQEPAGGFALKTESKESDFAAWLTEQMVLWHAVFEAEFTLNFSQYAAAGKGEFFSGGVTSTPEVQGAALRKFLDELWADTIGFTGMKLIRRIVGVSHVADLEEIADLTNRSYCERKCLLLARLLVTSAVKPAGGSVRTIQILVESAKTVFAQPASTLESFADLKSKSIEILQKYY